MRSVALCFLGVCFACGGSASSDSRAPDAAGGSGGSAGQAAGVAGAGAPGSAGSGGGSVAGASAPSAGRAGAPDAGTPAVDAGRGGWNLVWFDEFDGGKLDETRWAFELGGGGWGNGEWQVYTNRSENVRVEGGQLVITALRDDSGNITSARLRTRGKLERTYGRFEARIQVPRGAGMWPAFWMLGADLGQVRWPDCGEIDIMENKGREPTVVHGTIHGPGYSGGGGLTAAFTSRDGSAFADRMHDYAVEWEPNVVRFYVDDVLYATRTPADLGARKWVYDHPFFLLLNLAVGGAFGGDPDESTVFPQTMRVDRVRVYSR